VDCEKKKIKLEAVIMSTLNFKSIITNLHIEYTTSKSINSKTDKESKLQTFRPNQPVKKNEATDKMTNVNWRNNLLT